MSSYHSFLNQPFIKVIDPKRIGRSERLLAFIMLQAEFSFFFMSYFTSNKYTSIDYSRSRNMVDTSISNEIPSLFNPSFCRGNFERKFFHPYRDSNPCNRLYCAFILTGSCRSYSQLMYVLQETSKYPRYNRFTSIFV